MEQRLIAIWGYDLPPYYLASEIVSFQGDYVSVKGYASYMFKPVKIYRYEEGIVIKEKLEKLGNEYSQKCKELLQVTRSSAEDLLK